jgi:rRNA-processing protein FCF1
VVPTPVIRELHHLLSKGHKLAKAALALSKKYESVDIKGLGDGPLFNLAVNRSWPVMTMDRKLRDNLLKNGVSVVFVRDRGKLELREP